MATLQHLLQYILHFDSYLMSWVATYGTLTYIALFAIIFCETGLVIFPFLPGDSLLFAAGSIAASDTNTLNIHLLFFLLVLASTIGNKVNYLIGRALGPRVFHSDRNWLLNRRHLAQAHDFYQQHGGKAIIFARFIPIIRTFAPFVAGVGAMPLSQFSFYNLASAFLWIGSLTFAGYFFGNLPFIQANFALLVYAIIAISLLPPLIAFILKRRQAHKSA